MAKQKSAAKWSAEEKLTVITETRLLGEQELGLYLRTHGIHGAQLSEWRSDVLRGLAPMKPVKQFAKKDARDETIRGLEREIRRKDKALSEVSALLILQKKIGLIWGNSDEERP